MSYRDEVEKVLNSVNYDAGKAAVKIYNREDRGVVMYVLELGLLTFARKSRAETRRTMRNTIINPRPMFVKGSVTGSIKPSAAQQRRINKATSELFMVYLIGKTPLGEATKEFLMSASDNERASSKGHLRNAYWYSALAEPMAAGQKVKDYWKDSKAASLIRDEIWRTTEKAEPTFAAA